MRGRSVLDAVCFWLAATCSPGPVQSLPAEGLEAASALVRPKVLPFPLQSCRAVLSTSSAAAQPEKWLPTEQIPALPPRN